MPKSQKRRGHPPRPTPERIDATPEQIAEASLRMPADYQRQYPPEDNPDPAWTGSGFLCS